MQLLTALVRTAHTYPLLLTRLQQAPSKLAQLLRQARSALTTTKPTPASAKAAVNLVRLPLSGQPEQAANVPPRHDSTPAPVQLKLRLRAFLNQVLGDMPQADQARLVERALAQLSSDTGLQPNQQGFLRLPIIDQQSHCLLYCHVPHDPAQAILPEPGQLLALSSKNAGAAKFNAGEIQQFITLKMRDLGPVPPSEIIAPAAWHGQYPSIKLPVQVDDHTLIVSSAGQPLSRLLARGELLQVENFSQFIRDTDQMEQDGWFLFDFKPANMGIQNGQISTFDNSQPRQVTAGLKLGQSLPFTAGYFPRAMARAVEAGDMAAWKTASAYSRLVSIIECCLPDIAEVDMDDYYNWLGSQFSGFGTEPYYNEQTAEVLDRYLPQLIKPEYLSQAQQLLQDPLAYSQQSAASNSLGKWFNFTEHRV